MPEVKGYKFTSCPGPEVETEPLARLFDVAFTGMEGALEAGEDFHSWFLLRPGLWAFSAWRDDEMLANVWVTLVDMYLGQSLIKTAVIDGVCTHPQHRRKSLATRLLKNVAQFIKEKGCDLSLLYTLSPTREKPHPAAYNLYQKLGYEEAARINYLVHPGAFCRTGASSTFDPGLKAGPIDEAEERRFIDFLNTHFEYRDGYVPASRQLWRWRKEMRPASLTCDFYFYEKAGGILAAITLSGLRVFLQGKPTRVTHLGEIVLLPRAGDEAFALFLALIPRDTRAVVLIDEKDEATTALLSRFGFRVPFQEVAMGLALSKEGEKAFAQRRDSWYALTESIIGV